jgi:HEAT repeat protein
MHSAIALGKIGSNAAVQPLIGMLDDSDSRVRMNTIISLGKLRDPRALVPLSRFLTDRQLASHAHHAMKKIESQQNGVPVSNIDSGKAQKTLSASNVNDDVNKNMGNMLSTINKANDSLAT